MTIMSKTFITRLKRFPNRYRTLHFFYCRIGEFLRQDEVSGISPGITYYLIMGFIPFLIFSVNVVLFTTVADIDFVLEIVRKYFPGRVSATLEEDIFRIIDQRSDLWLWVSLFAAAFSFEKALAILVRASDWKTYGGKVKKSVSIFKIINSKNFLVHLKSALYAIGLVVVIIISLGLMVFGKILLEWVNSGFQLSDMVFSICNLLIYVIPFVALVVYLTIFYQSAPRSYTPRLLHSFVTAFIVTILWIFATIIYRWVLMIIPSIGESYGPLFGLFTMFLWFYYIVSIIILGIGIIKAWTRFQTKLNAVSVKDN